MAIRTRSVVAHTGVAIYLESQKLLNIVTAVLREDKTR
jgi:hypothetical protein